MVLLAIYPKVLEYWDTKPLIFHLFRIDNLNLICLFRCTAAGIELVNTSSNAKMLAFYGLMRWKKAECLECTADLGCAATCCIKLT